MDKSKAEQQKIYIKNLRIDVSDSTHFPFQIIIYTYMPHWTRTEDTILTSLSR